MLKLWEKILWFLFVMLCIAVIVLIVWLFVNRYTVPKLLPIITYAYGSIFAIYLIVKGVLRKKKQKQIEMKSDIEAIYKKLQEMNLHEKNNFASSEDAVYYFEKVEEVKEVITPEEASKYKTVLFGTEEPYIVTEEGKIIVKASPGNLMDK